MQIVGFGGLAKAGKTTAACILSTWAFERGYHVVADQFARPLKMAARMMGFIKGGEYDDLYRDFCQYAGTDLARKRGHVDWFANLMQKRLDVYALEEQQRMAVESGPITEFHETIVIVDDLRFQNEVDLLNLYKGRTVFICAAQRLKDMDAKWRQHESEALAYDYTYGRLPDKTFNFSVPNNKWSVSEDDHDGITFPLLIKAIHDLAPTLASLDAAERLHE